MSCCTLNSRRHACSPVLICLHDATPCRVQPATGLCSCCQQLPALPCFLRVPPHFCLPTHTRRRLPFCSPANIVNPPAFGGDAVFYSLKNAAAEIAACGMTIKFVHRGTDGASSHACVFSLGG